MATRQRVVGRELRGASTTANEASASTAAERGTPWRKREGGEWCGEEEDRRVGGKAGGAAWAWTVGLRERSAICARVGRKMRSIIVNRNVQFDSTQVQIHPTQSNQLHVCQKCVHNLADLGSPILIGLLAQEAGAGLNCHTGSSQYGARTATQNWQM